MPPRSDPLRVAHLSIVHKPLDVRIFHKECRTLAAAGHEVHLVVPDPPVGELDGARFHAIPGVSRVRHVWSALPHLAAVHRAARSLAADVHHLHDPHLVPVGLALKREGKLVVYDAHEDAPRQALSVYDGKPLHKRAHWAAWSLLDRSARRRFDAFVAATPAIARRFPAARTVTVRNFPLLEEFAQPALDGARVPFRDRPPAVAYAGGISPMRCIREMVDMLELLPAELGARLVVMGEFARTFPRLEADCRARAGWSKVDYLGYLPRAEVVARLARARAGLVLLYPLPNHVEAMPNKLWEYMAAGLPVVGSDFPLWRRIVGDIGCGLLVDPTDPRAIARAVEWLVRHPDEAEAMGQRGREAVGAGYNWSVEGERLLELYERLRR